MKNKLYIPLLLSELKLYAEARAVNDHNACFKHLGRAHIISQLRWFHHFYVHFLMFEYAWWKKDYKEVRGQFLRLIVTIPGHLFKKLPVGNIGWSEVGLRETSPVPNDLRKLFE